jgi:hypothetical protein
LDQGKNSSFTKISKAGHSRWHPALGQIRFPDRLYAESGRLVGQPGGRTDPPAFEPEVVPPDTAHQPPYDVLSTPKFVRGSGPTNGRPKRRVVFAFAFAPFPLSK